MTIMEVCKISFANTRLYKFIRLSFPFADQLIFMAGLGKLAWIRLRQGHHFDPNASFLNLSLNAVFGLNKSTFSVKSLVSLMCLRLSP